MRLCVITIELIGAIILLIAVGSALFHLIRSCLSRDVTSKIGETRLNLGRHLVLALEFLIAADILKTVVAPSMEELALLGGTILIRTVLSLSIAYEVKEAGGARPL